MADQKTERRNSWNIGRLLLGGAAAIALVSVAYAITRSKDEAPTPPPTALPSAPADPEQMIASLQNRVGANPKDVEGWQLLGWAYFDAQRYADAVRAYRRATQLQPGNAVFWSSLGEAIVMASERDPMPKEALDAFKKSASLDAKDPRARYFLAVKRDLDGDHQGAIDDWFALLKDTPPGAPWESDLRRTIAQVAKINKIDVEKRLADLGPATPHPGLAPAAQGSVATQAIPGPTREQMQAAAALPPGQQQSMVEGMVSGLEAKLAANPSNVDGWIMLMRSRMTLGETSKASAALGKAVAANPAQAARIKGEARLLGVPGAN